MTIYKDVNGREFTYNEYWNKVYLDEKRPHVDHMIRHKWPEEKPTTDGEYLVRLDTGDEVVYKVLYIVDQYTPWTNYVTHWWNLPEVMECI